RRRARRKNRHISPALALEFQLGLLQALADLVVGNRDDAVRADLPGLKAFELGDLGIAIHLQRFRRGGVVAMAVDDHRRIALSIWSSSAIVGRQLSALDSGTRPSRIALVNSTSCRSNAAVPSSGTSFPSLPVIESRYTLYVSSSPM